MSLFTYPHVDIVETVQLSPGTHGQTRNPQEIIPAEWNYYGDLSSTVGKRNLRRRCRGQPNPPPRVDDLTFIVGGVFTKCRKAVS